MAPPRGSTSVHPVNFVNIINGNISMYSLNETACLSKFIVHVMLSNTLINSHSWVSDPWPKGPLVEINIASPKKITHMHKKRVLLGCLPDASKIKQGQDLAVHSDVKKKRLI